MSKETITLFLTLMLSFTACAGQPDETPNPAALEVRATETQTPPSTATAEATEMPDWTPTVNSVIIETPTLTPTIDPKPVFKTSIGDLVIEAVRWVDEANGVSPGPDERLMLITLGKPGQERLDRSNFPLETFDKALRDQSRGEVHISSDDGSYAVCSMAGWVGPKYEEFVMGFRLPSTAKTFQLFWPGNEPIDLHPDELQISSDELFGPP